MKRLSPVLLALFLIFASGLGHAAVSVGIVQHDPKKSDNKVGQFLAESLPSAGLSVQLLATYDDLADSKKIDPSRFQTLVIPESPLYPAVAADALHRYLKKGGSLVALGGDPFSRPLYRYGNQWMEEKELASALAADPKSARLADPETMAADVWIPKRDNKQAPSAARIVSEDGKKAFLFQHRAVWTLDAFQLSVAPPASNADALLFDAKADGFTPQTTIRIFNKKGESFEAIIEVRTEWAPVFVPLSDFQPMGNGEAPTSIQDVSKIVFAMAEVRHARGDHDVYVRSIHGVKLPPGAFKPIETEGFILCEDRDLYHFDDAVQTVPAEGTPVSAFTASGHFTGISAIGFPFFGESTYVPLLEARDQYGRRRGFAAGLIVNEAGQWQGSRWAIFGVKESDWYLTKPFAQYVAGLIQYMVKKAAAPKQAQATSTLRQAQGKQAQEKQGKPAQGVASRPKTPLPRLTIRDGAFVRPDGSPFYVIGENISGNLYDRSFGKYDADALERLFSHLEEAGVTAIRMLNVNTEVERNEMNLICDVAERHGVYLLLGATPYPREKHNTANDIRQYAAKLASQLKDRSVVLGYDLCNEPYVHQIAAYKNDSGQTLGEVYGQNAANYRKYLDSIEAAGAHTPDTMRGIDGVLQEPKDPEEAAAYRAINGIFGDWISWFKDGFKKAGDTHPITVGYNMWYSAMPCNRALDFVNQHAYVMPTGYDRVVGELSTLDRLHHCFPDKPITFGEFGYTNGYILKGRPLSDQCQAVGEMMHHLTAWSKGYSGAFDWQVYDWDPVQYPRIAVWNRDKPAFHNTYERFHGIYAWDGTPQGYLKPAGMAMRFLSEAIAAGMDHGTLKIVKDDTTQIGASYVFTAKNALIVGATKHNGDGLTFDTASDAISKAAGDVTVKSAGDATVKAANEEGEERTVAMYWTADKLTITSTGDVKVTVHPASLHGCAVKLGAPVKGRTGFTKWNGEDLEMLLLAGEPVAIGN